MAGVDLQYVTQQYGGESSLLYKEVAHNYSNLPRDNIGVLLGRWLCVLFHNTWYRKMKESLDLISQLN